jgi:asparagine synthase (glutamine-hydrolysing)
MFRAPLAESFFTNPPPFVRQLMSPESLRRAGYFDVQSVRHDYGLVHEGKADKLSVFLKMGLSGVLATQLWHHINFGGLCELPEMSPRPQVERPRLPPEAA